MWRIVCLAVLLLAAAAPAPGLARPYEALTEATPDARAKIQATLDRIGRGERDPHRNDGAVYRNLNRVLPLRARGYYHEYVYRARRYGPVGPERVIAGQGGDVYYTPDHYETFQRFVP